MVAEGGYGSVLLADGTRDPSFRMKEEETAAVLQPLPPPEG